MVITQALGKQMSNTAGHLVFNNYF